MCTPSEWTKTAKRLRQMLDEIEKRCRHQNRTYSHQADPFHTIIHVYCKDCGGYLGSMG